MQKKGFIKNVFSAKAAANECFNIIKNINTKVLSLAISVVMLLGTLGIVTKYYTFAYSVYYGDVNVGIISSKEDAMEAYNEAETDVVACNMERFDHDLRFVMTIAPISATAGADIYRSIVEAAVGKVDCYSIETSGICVTKLETKEAAEEAIREYARSFREDAAVYTSYTICSTEGIVTEIESTQEAVETIGESGLFNVIYKDIYEENVVIPFTETIIQDKNVPKGVELCYQQGAEGEGIRREITLYENGVKREDYETVLEVVKEPVERIVHVGTGEMVGLVENSLIWPAEGTFTSEYGRRWGRNHNGIDIAAKTGTPICAPAMGKVIFSGTRNGYGNYVEIDHGNGYVTTYAHMNTRLVKEGDVVCVGDQIGTIGTTGRVTGAHLHFEVLVNGKFTDPMIYIIG